MRRFTRTIALIAVITITLTSCTTLRAPRSQTTKSGALRLSTVNGITVNSVVAGPVTRMVASARQSGIRLTGGGYRSTAQQISLRRAHCGTSSYAIYEKSSSTCQPPTARPGHSMHEQGLAIDFNSSSTHATAVFRWLAGHAARYGFYNLASEPWHWSTNGH